MFAECTVFRSRAPCWGRLASTWVAGLMWFGNDGSKPRRGVLQAKTGIVVVAVTEGGEAHGRLEGLVSPKDADLIDDRETLLHEIMDA